MAEAISSLCNDLIKMRKFKTLAWLKAIPLYHFLQGQCHPFQKPEMNPMKIIWWESVGGLELYGMRGGAEPG